MADGNWDAILDDYRINREAMLRWGIDLELMEKLILRLRAERDLSMLYPITSLFKLHLVIAGSFAGSRGRPRLIISLNPHVSTFEFALVAGKDAGGERENDRETINCPFDRALDVFDELFARLKTIVG